MRSVKLQSLKNCITDLVSMKVALFSLFLLLAVVVSSLSAVTNVHATKATILQVGYPSTVTQGSAITITIQFTAVFTGGPEQNGQYQGDYGVLTMGIVDMDNNQAAIKGSDITVGGTPTPCNPGSYLSSTGLASTNCAFIASHPQIDETVQFTFSISDLPTAATWHLRVIASVLDMGMGVSSANYDFTVSTS